MPPGENDEQADNWCPECAGGRAVRDPKTDTYLPCPACVEECPTLGVCPNCREGWGHWDGTRHFLTVESMTSPRREATA